MGGDTIFALASGRGAAGIAVFRISGPGADGALLSLGGGCPPARVATRVRLVDPDTGEALDEALALRFPAPASFTGEDVVELHVHGGRAVGEAVAGALGRLPGLRPAEPGEFTRRAFASGKLDLAQAEGLADLVAAETEAQRRQALAQFGGALSRRFEGWREDLIGQLAEVEAVIDFADEDIPQALLDAVLPKISALRDDLYLYMDDRGLGERLREGFRIAIVGAPNVGKSSLLNALAEREAAIVSETEGTTRDVIEVHLDLGGVPVVIADTAGLRVTADAIEAEGVRRARQWAEAADLRLAVVDARSWPVLDAATAAVLAGPGDSLVAVNKSDLVGLININKINVLREFPRVLAACPVSARSGDGLAALLGHLEAVLARRLDSLGPAPMTRVRHRRALADAVAALDRALGLADAAAAAELLAEDLRLAARALGRIAGRVDVEDVLGEVFSRFCIGK